MRCMRDVYPSDADLRPGSEPLREDPVKALRRHLALLGALAAVIPACSGDPVEPGSGGDTGVGNGGDAVHTLSGTIDPPAGTDADSDTNDELAPYASNDSFALAQRIDNPVAVGGYANAPGWGAAGRSFLSGDAHDFYDVSLVGGQRITLSVADASTLHDLDLYLHDENENLVDFSIEVDAWEEIVVPATGRYFVEVRVYSGASNYVLAVGQETPVSTDAAAPPRFVPGEVIVRLESPLLQALDADGVAERLATEGMRVLAGAPDRPILLGFADAADRRATFSGLGVAHLSTDWEALGVDPTSESARRMDTIQLVKALRSRPGVRSADLNYLHQSLAVPTDALYRYQWHYPQIHLPEAWDDADGTGTVVAVIDTGVRFDHPDLATQLTANGYDFIRSTSISVDGDGIDDDPTDPGDRAPGGSSFHGTHVSGTVAAQTRFDGTGQGVAGVAYGARVMPLRVLGVGGGTTYDISQAVLYAGGLPNDSGTTVAPVDVINMSLGGPGFSAEFQDAIDAATANGVVIVAAAGNSSSSTPTYPAAYDHVLSVVATDLHDERAPYSNFGPSVDLAAPGGDMSADDNGDGLGDGVLSTAAEDAPATPDLGYLFAQGTSMAAPHVAGVVALMKQVDPSLTPSRIDNLLASGAVTRDLGAQGRDDIFGHGLIDAASAVRAAAQSPGISPVLVVTPGALSLSATQDSKTFTTSNAGAPGLTDVDATADRSWLTLTDESGDPDGLGTWRVSADRTGLASGTHSATVTVTSSMNSVSVPVLVQVGSVSGSGNTGFLYVILADPDTFATIDTVGVGLGAGRYRYAFSGVPTGRYLVIAGSDYDQDDVICDPGEACGGYPTLDQLDGIAVGSDLTGIDFATQLSADIGASEALAKRPTGFSPAPRAELRKRLFGR
jgi:serine protease